MIINEDEEIVIHHKLNFFQRILVSLKYIFGFKTALCLSKNQDFKKVSAKSSLEKSSKHQSAPGRIIIDDEQTDDFVILGK